VATARTSPVETEIKLAVPSAPVARRLLAQAQFHISKRRAFESNIVLDTPERWLQNSGSLLRIRQASQHVTVTYKGPARPSKHKSREELEVEAGDAATLQRIFARLGFRPAFRYEKYRSEYRGQGSGIVTLDETPIGVYLELEGPPRWIDRTAQRLGFAESDYITASYGRLYLEWCQNHHRKPGHMVF
jgi:adenylate cyclase, class 2